MSSAVELRLGKKSTRQLQNLVGSAQFLDFALQDFDAIALLTSNAIAQTRINLVFAHPLMQGLGDASDLWRNRLNGSPQAAMLAAVLLHQANRAFTYFRGKTI